MFVKWFQDRQESEFLTSFITILGVCLAFMVVAVVPADIYFVSSLVDPVSGQRYKWVTSELISQVGFYFKLFYFGTYF